MENINQFVFTCESWIIDTDCFTTANESLTDKIKSGVSWLLNRAKELLAKFVAWVKSFFIKFTNAADVSRLKKMLTEKCRNDKKEVFTFIKDIDKKVLERAFPKHDLVEYYSGINNAKLGNSLASYVASIENPNTTTNEVTDTVENIIPKLVEVLHKGYKVSESVLKVYEDQNDELKDKKSEIFTINIDKIVSDYSGQLKVITNNYSAIKSEMQQITNSLQRMNQDLARLKQQVDSNSNSISQEDYSRITNNVTNVNKCVNGTVVSHSNYVMSVQASSSKYVYYIDRLTYGRDPNSAEAQAMANYPIPDYNKVKAIAETLRYPGKDSVKIAEFDIDGYPTKVWVSLLIVSALTTFTKLSLVEQDSGRPIHSNMLSETDNQSCTIIIPANYFILDKGEKYYKFVLYHEYGHVLHKDNKLNMNEAQIANANLKNQFRVAMYSMLKRQDKHEENADLNAIKNLNMSKNEYEKEYGKLKIEAHDLLQHNPQLSNSLVDQNMKLINGREKQVLKRFNKEG